MKLLKRNMREVVYANPTKSEYQLDENGLRTGGKSGGWEEPKTFMAHVGIPNGNAVADSVGIHIQYTRTLFTELPCPVKEGARLWIDSEADGVNDWFASKVAPSMTFAVVTAGKGGSR